MITKKPVHRNNYKSFGRIGSSRGERFYRSFHKKGSTILSTFSGRSNAAWVIAFGPRACVNDFETLWNAFAAAANIDQSMFPTIWNAMPSNSTRNDTLIGSAEFHSGSSGWE
ncbi:MAG: hypothetical protein ACRESZ_16975 [Methylococcales bacterium]